MRKLISFCLWGRDPKYLIGAVENALLREKFYNDWVCRFYIHVDVPNFSGDVGYGQDFTL
jgi:hypothetical protein